MQYVNAENVEHSVLGIVQEINRRYNGRVKVQYLDPDRFAELTDAPYRIVEVRDDGQEDLIFSVWQLDGRVLNKLAMLDEWHGISSLERLVQQEKKRKQDKANQRLAEKMETRNLIKSALANDRAYSFKNAEGELVTIHSDKPATKRVNGNSI